MIAVLLPPPLGAPARLPNLAGSLPDHGFTPVIPEVDGDDQPPHAARYVARASLEINRLADSDTWTALVAEGDAGPLLGAVSAAQRAAHRPVFAYVLVDAWLPQPGSPTRADIVSQQSPEGSGPTGAGGDSPAGTDSPRDSLASGEAVGGASTGAEPAGYRTERLPTVPDWPDAPCGYLLTDPARAHVARLARMRGWTVRDVTAEGTGAGADEGAAAAEALAELLTALR